MEGDYKVLVTTSGIGSRLGDLTNYTNKSLVNLGDKPAISWIIESYSPKIPIVITLGHFGMHVKEYLTIAHPERTFEFVDVANFNGPGSSLASSMYQAKDNLQCPFIFHASDTIIQNWKIPKPTENWVAGFSSLDSTNYSSFNHHMGKVVTFYPKGWSDYDLLHIGLVGIKDFGEFWEALKDVLQENPNTPESNDISAIEKMIHRGICFVEKTVTNWIDIGNLDYFNKAKRIMPSKYHILEKRGESIYFVQNSVIKFFAESNLCKMRIKRAEILTPVTPSIQQKGNYFYSYKFLEGDVLSDVAHSVNTRRLLEWADTNLWLKKKTLDDHDFNQLCEKFYIQKTQNRVKDFFSKTGIKDQEQMINGVLVPKVDSLIEQCNQELVSNGIQSRFHGDFVLDNLIETEHGIRAIDWRPDFAGNLETGDLYYDLAKLNHSFHVNHKIVINNLFKVEYKNQNRSSVIVDIHRNQSLVSAERELFRFVEFKGYSKKRIRLITAIIWLNMSSLHHHPFDMFLFYLGKLYLAKALELQNE